jgi:ketosteroid isomerase-like protein
MTTSSCRMGPSPGGSRAAAAADPGAPDSRADLDVVGRMYQALARRDPAAISGLLHEQCVVRTAPGLPFAGGRTTHGPREALQAVWAEINLHFDVQPEPETCIPGPPGTVVCIGVYRGHARSTGHRFEAWFAHVWQVEDGEIVGLRQITDTATWAGALRRPGGRVADIDPSGTIPPWLDG